MSQLDAFVKRIDELLATQVTEDRYAVIVAAHTGALTLASAIYGAGRPQIQLLLDAVKKANSEKQGRIDINYWHIVWPAVQGPLLAMKGDLQSGVLADIERRAAGAVLADMLGLAKEALNEGSDGARNVAAVLTAASYEDTIRKMGDAFAGVVGRPDLADVLTARKNAEVLKGASVGTAQSYLKFRNDALHADWTKLTTAVVASCISFVEHLLLQHFS
jgi:hypothetical protein